MAGEGVERRASEEWLQTVLASYHDHPHDQPNIEIMSWSEEHPKEKQGMLSDPFTAAVQYRVRGEPRHAHLFCKLAPKEQLFRDMLTKLNCDLREIKFYTTVKPAVDTLERQHLGATQDSHWAPELYFAKYVEGGGYTLVLENLAAKGFAMVDYTKGMDLKVTKAVLTSLANFHAGCLALQKSTGKTCEQIFPYIWPVDKVVEFYVGYLRDNFGKTLKRLQSRGDCKDTCEAMQRFLDNNPAEVQRRAMLPSENMNTIIHNDFWNNNVMVKHKGDDNIQVCIIDWQTISYGSPALDVAMLLWSSVAPDVRREYGPQFKDHYWQVLTTRLAQLGVQDLCCTREDFLQEFARADVDACLKLTSFAEDLLEFPGGEERCLAIIKDIFKYDFWLSV